MDLLILVWIVLSLIVGVLTSDKSIGFWGGFILSLLLSPLIGLIIGLVSSGVKKNESAKKVPEFINYMETAQRLENRGDLDEAIKFYKDAVFDINKSPKTDNGKLLKFRFELKNEAIASIHRLEGVIN